VSEETSNYLFYSNLSVFFYPQWSCASLNFALHEGTK
jgi:hypothetical protein